MIDYLIRIIDRLATRADCWLRGIPTATRTKPPVYLSTPHKPPPSTRWERVDMKGKMP